MKTTRILHVISNLDIGGAEKRLLDITRQVDQNRVKLHFCTFSKRPGKLCPEFQAAGATLHLLPLDVYFSFRFKRLLRELRFDAVHAHMHNASGYVLRLASQAGTAVRIAHYRSCQDGKNSSLRRQMQRRLLHHWIDKHATHILACGRNAMLNNWGSRWEDDRRCKIVYNGIDPLLFHDLNDRDGVSHEFNLLPENPLYIHVGNIRRPKNHTKLLAVFARILEITPTANLLLVGRGDNEIEQDLHSLAQTYGISDRVVFAGLRNDVPRLLRAADAMIFPSLWEGLPGAILEACAAGIPVLASDLPEIREIAEYFPLIHCLTLSQRDQDWAREAISLCQHIEDTRKMRSVALTFDASPFHIRKCVSSLYEVWENKLPDSHKKHPNRAA
jgi:glycosyltransferase involved in cell wall biosynthesis